MQGPMAARRRVGAAPRLSLRGAGGSPTPGGGALPPPGGGAPPRGRVAGGHHAGLWIGQQHRRAVGGEGAANDTGGGADDTVRLRRTGRPGAVGDQGGRGVDLVGGDDLRLTEIGGAAAAVLENRLRL